MIPKHLTLACFSLLFYISQVYTLFTTSIDQLASLVSFSSGWGVQDYPNAFGGSFAFSRLPGVWVEIALPSNTISVEYIGFQAYSGSTYHYCVDCAIGGVSSYNGVAKLPGALSEVFNEFPVVIFSVLHLDPDTQHVLTVMNLPDSASTSSTITFDAVIVIQEDSETPSSTTSFSSSASTVSSGASSFCSTTSVSSSTTTFPSSQSSPVNPSSTINIYSTSHPNSDPASTHLISSTGIPLSSSMGSSSVPPVVFPSGTFTSTVPANSAGGGQQPFPNHNPDNDNSFSPAVIAILASFGFMSLLLGAIVFIHTRSNRMIAMIPERPAETRLERGADLEGTMSEYTDDSSHFYFVGGREDSRVSRSDSPPLDQLEYALRRDTVTDSVVSNNTASVTPSGRDIRQRAMLPNYAAPPWALSVQTSSATKLQPQR